MQILCRVHFCCHCCGDGGGFSVAGSVCGCSHERLQRPSGGDFGTDLLRAQHRGERHRHRSGGRLLLLDAPVAMGRRARLYPLLARRWRLLHQRRQGGAAEPTPPSATGARSSAGAVRTSRETPPGAVSPPWGSSPPTPRPSKSARFFLSE